MKQTAANNKTLARIKRIFNNKIFKHASQIMNTEGEAATLEYLQQFVRSSVAEMLEDERYNTGAPH